MFVIVLRYGDDRDKAQSLSEGHIAWLGRGFDSGNVLLAGMIEPRDGGVLFAHGLSRTEVEAYVAEDPFVANCIVTAEIIEVIPGRTDERLAFLKG